MHNRRVLVVGTTPDYIAYINERYRGRALFITDPAQRIGAREPAPDRASEIVCDLSDFDKVMTALRRHVRRFGLSLSGVACYDCEWLILASRIAQQLRLPFPSRQAVQTCRNKYLSKQRWQQHGVLCPRTEYVKTGPEAVRFLDDIGRPMVLKPLSGSGSELTFRCDDPREALSAMRTILNGLRLRSDLPMYRPDNGNDAADPRDTVLAEEYIDGREYSCDFVLEDSSVTIIRVAKKLRRPGSPFGTTVAYVLPARLPGMLDEDILKNRLREAAQALGLKRAICMVDFMISQDRVVFLELTPRIGGDCLPPLIRQSCGLDTIELALDFAEGRALKIPEKSQWQEMVGLRLFARQGGTLRNFDLRKLSDDSRVKEIVMKRSSGHHITLPPEDYDSWMLGHVIFRPEPKRSIEEQCNELSERLVIHLEPNYDQKLAGFYTASRRIAQPADAKAG